MSTVVQYCAVGHLQPPPSQRQYSYYCHTDLCHEKMLDPIIIEDSNVTMPMIRQGDVLLVKIGEIPAGAKPVKRDKGRLILAYGEATGHAHVVESPPEKATLLTDGENRRFLRLMEDSKLSHEEHTNLHIPAGNYEQVPQQEWQDSMNQREPERGTVRPVFD